MLPLIEQLNEIIAPLCNKDDILISGLTNESKAHIISTIIQLSSKPSVIITYDELSSKQLLHNISFFLQDMSYIYPTKDIIFFSADVHSKNIIAERFSIINQLLNKNSNKPPILIMSIKALLDKLTPKEKFKNAIQNLQVGDNIIIEDLIKTLIFMGYTRTEIIESEGQFAIRGGIVDIYSPTSPMAYRLEFFGDEIDSIRTLDITSQRSQEKVNDVIIFPMSELIYTQDELDKAITKIRSEYNSVLNSFKENNQTEQYERLKQSIGEALYNLENNRNLQSIDKFFSYFYSGESLLSYLDNDTLIFLDEPNKTKHTAETTLQEYIEMKQSRILNGYILPSMSNMFFSYEELNSMFNKFSKVLLMTMQQTPLGFNPIITKQIRSKEISLIKNNIESLANEILQQNEIGANVIILANTNSKATRLQSYLLDYGVSTSINNKFSVTEIQNTPKNNVITVGSITRGFEYKDYNLSFISDTEVFKKAKKHTSRKKSIKIENFTDLIVGDYIVHDNHGIGIYNGLETIFTDNIYKDYLKVSYAGADIVYISINQIDKIQKYIGGDNVSVKRMGGVAWEKAKNKVKDSVKILASELALLYGKRNSVLGYEYTKDTVWQAEFEETFQFQETDDQLLAIEDVKTDMESSKVMDRLVCGDVGFGKTEVAIRAAFKAVQDNKQVAFLVPTTILAQQHYMTFKERMKDYPINIELLSRFRTKSEQNKSIKNLKGGMSDIVIGTHRLLSLDVNFKDLGLVIVDEEQRFGVSHKEKLKMLTVNVDVLTLTATPIPRTLHMSLTGIRDISLLQDPPTNRKNIQTFVLEYDIELIKTAITRELARGGQIYYLSNRVKGISKVSKIISEIVPQAKVSFAHGQMSETELENIMVSFIQGDIDVLVCTTIIETGLDIPNVNTIIIQDADKMGLSQLYQLRGRVGRSDKIAYSYLMYKRDKVLDETASARLQTIRDFTEFGSGFKVALKDLEIRGVGSLLGSEQSGHMGTVGYELYSRMLEEAVKEINGEEVIKYQETNIDIKINAYIPNSYIKNEKHRLNTYKKISHIKDEKDYYEIQEEIEDKYGDIPKVVENLLNIALLKGISASIGIIDITQKQVSIVIHFKDNANINPTQLIDVVASHKNLLLTTPSVKENLSPYITYKGDKEITENNVKELIKIVMQLSNL